MVRSCYKSRWNFPGHPDVPGRFFFAPPDAKFYQDWNYFGSRNWHEGDGTPWPVYGERESVKQGWDAGGFPVRPPDAAVIGKPACIAGAAPMNLKAVLTWHWSNFPPPRVVSVLVGQRYPPVPCPFPILSPVLLLQRGPLGSMAAALRYLRGVPRSGPIEDYSVLNQSGYVARAGLYIETNIRGLYDIVPDPGDCERPTSVGDCQPYRRLVHGVDERCWLKSGVYSWTSDGGSGQGGEGWFDGPWTAQGGSKQQGAGDWATGSSWAAEGGSKQQGAGDWATGSSWAAEGGSKQQGAGDWSATVSWTAEGGSKQQGAGDWATGSSWTAEGGSKQQGAGDWATGSSWTAEGGSKQQGAGDWATGSSWTAAGGSKQQGAGNFPRRCFLQSTNADTTCDVGGEQNKDLGLVVGSGTNFTTTTSATFVEIAEYAMVHAGKSGLFSASIVITLPSVGARFRFRLKLVDASCATVATGTYTAELSGAGTKTFTDTITWPATATRVRLCFEQRTALGVSNVTITCGSSSYVDVP